MYQFVFCSVVQRSIVLLHIQLTLSLKHLFFPLITLVLQFVFFPCLFFSLLFSFSLITLYLPFTNPSSLSASPWVSFIRSKPHFRHSAYSGRPFSLQMPSFCGIKALVQNQFPLLSIMFFPPNALFFQFFLPINSLFTSLSDKDNGFSYAWEIRTRTRFP